MQKTMPIQNIIYEIRGQKVMLDRDLADLYGVELRILNQAVKRKNESFPPDFMFQLKQDEWDYLRSQFVTAKIENIDYKFSEYDETIGKIVYALNNLMEQPSKTKKIGFNVTDEE